MKKYLPSVEELITGVIIVWVAMATYQTVAGWLTKAKAKVTS